MNMRAQELAFQSQSVLLNGMVGEYVQKVKLMMGQHFIFHFQTKNCKIMSLLFAHFIYDNNIFQ